MDLRPARASDDLRAAPGAGLYVYCLTRDAQPRVTGIEGRDVYALAVDSLVAVVSDLPPATLLEPTREQLRAHQRVLEALTQEHAVIPLPFGTVVSSREELEALLRASSHAFADVLRRIEGKVEFGVTVRWDRERAVALVEEEDAEVRRLRAELEQLANGSSYFVRQELAHRTDDALTTLAARQAQVVIDELRPVVISSQSHEMPDDQLILDAAFLVAREAVAAFAARVGVLHERYAGLLAFQIEGPRPPTSFVNVKLALDRPAR